jgi:gas vesicle structural protein
VNDVRRADIPLVEIVDRLLEKGVVLAGGATISVAGVDLIELRLSVVLAAVDTFERALREEVAS